MSKESQESLTAQIIKVLTKLESSVNSPLKLDCLLGKIKTRQAGRKAKKVIGEPVDSGEGNTIGF